MKKGQKKLFKFINKTFKNAIILQQLRIDELNFRQELKKRSEKVPFPSGGVIVGVDFGESKNEERIFSKEEFERRKLGIVEGLKKTMKETMATAKIPEIADGCNCESCRIEREILKNVNKNDV